MLFNLVFRNEEFVEYKESLTVKDTKHIIEALYNIKSKRLNPIQIFELNSLYSTILKIAYQIAGEDLVQLIESIRFNNFQKTLELSEAIETKTETLDIPNRISLVFKKLSDIYKNNINNILNEEFLELFKSKEELNKVLLKDINVKAMLSDVIMREVERNLGKEISDKVKNIFNQYFEMLKNINSSKYIEEGEVKVVEGEIIQINNVVNEEGMKEPELVIPLPGPVKNEKKKNKKESKEFKTYDFSKILLIFNHYKQYGGYENMGDLYDPQCTSEKYKPFQYSIASTNGSYKTIRVVPLKEDNKVIVKIFEMDQVVYIDSEIASGEFLIGDRFIHSLNRSLSGDVGFLVNPDTKRIKLASNGVKNKVA